MTPPRRKRPANRSHLEKLISEAAKRDGIAPARLRRWISQMVIAGAFVRGEVHDDDHQDQFVVAIKGGVTMELRFGLHARATKDLDAVVTASREKAEQVLRDALGEPYEGFVFQVTPPEAIIGPDSLRCDVKLSYEGRAWSTERLEYSVTPSPIETELLPGIDLSAFGARGADRDSEFGAAVADRPEVACRHCAMGGRRQSSLTRRRRPSATAESRC